MFQKVGLPLILIAAVAALVLVVALIYRRWKRDADDVVEIKDWLETDRICAKKNPRTGWVCDRYEGHPGDKHWQDIEGERYDWTDD